ncbi:S8 family serine peptidase [Pseudomonas kilonensis]|uniref:S8 family serine peptidase n=1 Tax=Pseudomonas kilonensis TaxID=132476 RepID=UPI0033988EB9
MLKTMFKERTMPYPISALRALAITSASLLVGCLSIPERPGVEPAVFETPEYHAQRGLAVVKASALYARGGTGQDVTVALIDSGLSTGLKEFEGRLSDPGFDYVENRPGTVDRVGHGTQMAGVLAANKDDQGIHGIAFNARLIPFRFGDDTNPSFSTARSRSPGKAASTRAPWRPCKAAIHNSAHSKCANTCWRQPTAQVSTPTAKPMAEG